MNIKRVIDKNGKFIWYIVLIIIFVLFAIKSLNLYYEKEETKKKEEIINNNETIENVEQEDRKSVV